MQWVDLFSHVVEYDPAAADRPALPTGGGVYLLTDEHDRLIQLASAADLKRAILNRLMPASAQPEDKASGAGEPPAPSAGEPAAAPAEPPTPASSAAKRRADLSQIVRRIRWQPAHSAFEITYEYLRISRCVLPDTYLKNVAFGPAWFVHVDPAASIPRFTVSKLVASGPGTTLGPVATQADANKFVQILEDAFDLCRYIHILEQAPHGQPCAYYEMGRCPAPCGGLVPMERYREMIQAALRFAAGERRGQCEEWEAQMREAAGTLAFERAAAIKQRIDRVKGLDHAAYRFVRPVQAFSWLIVQRGGGRTRVKPFFVRAGRLQPGDTIRLKDLDTVVPEWIRALQESEAELPEPAAGSDTERLQELSEDIWLVSHFLCRRERTGLFLDAADLPDAVELAEMIRNEFAARPSVQDTATQVEVPADDEGGSAP